MECHPRRQRFGPYLACSAAVLTFALAKSLFALSERTGVELAGGVLFITLLTSAAMGLPVWLLQEGTPITALLVIPAVLLPATLVLMKIEGRSDPLTAPQWTASRFLSSLAVAGVVLLLQLLQVTPGWNPR